MADHSFTLLCLVDGEATSRTFPVEIESSKTVAHLKKAIKAEKANNFHDVDADELTLWRVTIPIIDDDDEASILLDHVNTTNKKKLGPATRLSRLFTELAEETVHVMVQRPLPQPVNDTLSLELSTLRQRLLDITDSSITLGIIVKPCKKITFSWSTLVDAATLGDLRKRIFQYYPHHAHNGHVQIFLYNGQPMPELISDDDDLRKILEIAKRTSATKLKIGLETPTKSFAAWSFSDVCREYNLSERSGAGLEVLQAFPDIQSMAFESDFQRSIQDQLICELAGKADAMPLSSSNEATKSIVIASFLAAATRLFKDDLYLIAQQELSGRRGHGPVDFAVLSKCHDYTLGVTEVKKENFLQGVAQNIVQLESALTDRKRKRGPYDVDGEESLCKQRAYGVVTDLVEWAFIECTLHGDESVSYRMSKLPDVLSFDGNWQGAAESIFGKLAWLWSQIVDEISLRDDSFNTQMNSPNVKRVK